MSEAIATEPPEDMIHFGIYPKQSALKLANGLAKHIDERVLLFGGGGPGSQFVTLEDVFVGPQHNRQTEHFDDGTWQVRIMVKAMDGEKSPCGDQTWAPYYGSWRIATFNDGHKSPYRKLREDGSLNMTDEEYTESNILQEHLCSMAYDKAQPYHKRKKLRAIVDQFGSHPSYPEVPVIYLKEIAGRYL